MKESRLIKIAVIFILLFAMSAGILMYFGIKKFEKEIDSIAIRNKYISGTRDGVYEGEYYPTPYVGARVKVTVDSGYVTSIELLDHKYGRGKPAEEITEKVISEQRLDVDTISGATISSKVILKAIDNALSQAD